MRCLSIDVCHADIDSANENPGAKKSSLMLCYIQTESKTVKFAGNSSIFKNKTFIEAYSNDTYCFFRQIWNGLMRMQMSLHLQRKAH